MGRRPSLAEWKKIKERKEIKTKRSRNEKRDKEEEETEEVKVEINLLDRKRLGASKTTWFGGMQIKWYAKVYEVIKRDGMTQMWPKSFYVCTADNFYDHWFECEVNYCRCNFKTIVSIQPVRKQTDGEFFIKGLVYSRESQSFKI